MTIATIIRPHVDWVTAYEDALRRGWSPKTDENVSREQLELRERFRHDPERFLHELYHSPTVRNAKGEEIPRLPAHDFWILDGAFCGRINFRFQHGTEDLPPWVSGHIGYAIVPWKRGNGYATEALRLTLPYARAEGLFRVSITCDDDNVASRKVILANGGVLSGETAHETRAGRTKLHYWVPVPA